MARKLDYRWNLRQLMASRGMFATTDLIGPLTSRGIALSSSQVYRLVVERPERLSLKVLVALVDILDCSMATGSIRSAIEQSKMSTSATSTFRLSRSGRSTTSL